MFLTTTKVVVIAKSDIRLATNKFVKILVPEQFQRRPRREMCYRKRMTRGLCGAVRMFCCGCRTNRFDLRISGSIDLPSIYQITCLSQDLGLRLRRDSMLIQ